MKDEEDGEDNPENEENKPKISNKKKNSDVVPLKRPIIFICNDMYAKALMPLRDFALTVKIEESHPERLIKRLRQICK